MKNLVLLAQIILVGCAAADDTAKNLAIAATATPAATATATSTATVGPASAEATAPAPDPMPPTPAPAPATQVVTLQTPTVSVQVAVSVSTGTGVGPVSATETRTATATSTATTEATATNTVTSAQVASAIATATQTATPTQTATQTAVTTHTATSTAVLATTANFNCTANFPYMGGGSLYQIYDATGIYQTCTIQNSNNWITQAASTPYNIGPPTTRAVAIANTPVGYHLASNGNEIEWAIKDRGEWPCPNNGFIWDTLVLESGKLMAFAPTTASNPGIFNGFVEQVYAGTLACPLYTQD